MASNKIQFVAPVTRHGEEKTLMEFTDRTSNVSLYLMGGRHSDGTETYEIIISSKLSTYTHDTFHETEEAIKAWAEFLKTYTLATLTQALGSDGEPQ